MAEPDRSPRGADMMLSYNKLLAFETSMVEIKSMLQATLALKGDVDRIREDVRNNREDHELRLVALEQIQATGIAEASVWKRLRTFGYGVLTTAVLGGGFAYLPAIVKWLTQATQ